jgi:hypothetical protein
MRLKILTSLALASVVLTLLTSQYAVSNAEPLNAYPPPTQVTIQMYRLNQNGTSTNISCSAGDLNWGCTAFCNNTTNGIRWSECAPGSTKPYPYSSNTPTVQIESDYLLDVVSHEAFPSILSAVAVEANAIAARSFTYGHIQANSTIDNSTNKHVFVPYRFERLNPSVTPNNSANGCGSTNLNSAQQKVCTGVARRYYVSYGTAPNDDFPAITQYFSDIRNATLAGTQPYEVSVADPISSDPAIVQLGHGKGMSQNGASRWGYGNTGFSGNLTPWSVQWTKPEHILFHYYTGVHLRDANNNNARLSPDYRWNPLAVNWGNGATAPPPMQAGSTYNVTIQVQNTGTVNWGSDVSLSCQWQKPNGSIVNCDTSANPGTLTIGSPAPTVTLPVRPNSNFGPGVYTLMIDMKQSATFFHNREAGRPWPTLNYTICVGGNCAKIYLPIILNDWKGLNCTYFIQTWYAVGTNVCDPSVSNCAEGDGQPDGAWAGPWSIGYHQVEFSPQLVLSQTTVGTYWKTSAGVYGNLYIDAKLDDQWTQLRTSLYQSTTGRWEQAEIGQYEGKSISGLRFGFSSSTAGHQFIVDGYRIDNFFSCTP